MKLIWVCWKRSRLAAALLIPYIAWVSFAAVLNREIELEDIDTEPFNLSRGRKPTLPSTREARNMVSGAVGRPGAVSEG